MSNFRGLFWCGVIIFVTLATITLTAGFSFVYEIHAPESVCDETTCYFLGFLSGIATEVVLFSIYGIFISIISIRTVGWFYTCCYPFRWSNCTPEEDQEHFESQMFPPMIFVAQVYIVMFIAIISAAIFILLIPILFQLLMFKAGIDFVCDVRAQDKCYGPNGIIGRVLAGVIYEMILVTVILLVVGIIRCIKWYRSEDELGLPLYSAGIDNSVWETASLINPDPLHVSDQEE